MSHFRANVQYDDWEGTAAADNADQNDLSSWLKTEKLIEDEEIVVGVSLWIGENHGKVATPQVRFLVVPAANAEKAQAYLNANDPVPLKEVFRELSVDQFLVLFKRFSVVLTLNKLGLTDREYLTEAEQ